MYVADIKNSLSSLGYAICWALYLGVANASPPLESSIQIRGLSGIPENRIIQAVRQEISEAAVQKRNQEFKVNTTFDRAWDNAVLLQFGAEQNIGNTNISLSEGVNIVCSSCYITGKVTGELSYSDDFNASQVIYQRFNETDEDFKDLTSDVFTYLKNYTEKSTETVFNQGFTLNDLAFPTFNYSFDLNISSVPEINLQFVFDELELYLLLDTALSLDATYTLNLYRSETPLGIEISPKLDLGIILSIDLILDVDGTIDVSSGFHIKLDDGLAINVALFGEAISDITFTGGQFEFLPVIVESAGIVLTAVLRVGVHAGFDLSIGDPGLTILNVTAPSVGGGIEVAAFADVGSFITNITASPSNNNCEIGVVQSYQFAVGAAAGATIDIDTHTWGPVAQTTTPIWYTQLDSACATKEVASIATKSPQNVTATASRAGKRQQGLTTTTLTSEITYTGVNCLSTGLINCPVSLQNTSQSTAISTIVTAVPSGATSISFPVSSQNSVSSTVTFGANAVKIPASSGSPVSYIPPPPPTYTTKNTTIPGLIGQSIDGKRERDNVIIGVTIGVGIPFLLVFIAAAFLVWRKRKGYAAVPRRDIVETEAVSFSGHDKQMMHTVKSDVKRVDVTELQT